MTAKPGFFQKKTIWPEACQRHPIVQSMLPAFDDDGRPCSPPRRLAIRPLATAAGFAPWRLRRPGLNGRSRHPTISTGKSTILSSNSLTPSYRLHDLTGADISSRALIKRDAAEKLGHFCQLNNRLYIVEYSDMPSDMLQQKDSDGRLRFRAGSPAIHILERDFVQRLTDGALDFLPHCAVKNALHDQTQFW